MSVQNLIANFYCLIKGGEAVNIGYNKNIWQMNEADMPDEEAPQTPPTITQPTITKKKRPNPKRQRSEKNHPRKTAGG